jgi:hypothetical protein
MAGSSRLVAAGGKCANQAVAAAKLGVHTVLWSGTCATSSPTQRYVSPQGDRLIHDYGQYSFYLTSMQMRSPYQLRQ